MSVKPYLNKFPFVHISSHLGSKNIRSHWDWDQFSYPKVDLACPLFQNPPRAACWRETHSPINHFLLAATKEAPAPTFSNIEYLLHGDAHSMTTCNCSRRQP